MDKGLLAGLDVDAFKARTRREPYARLWNHLVQRWEGVAARVAEAGKPFDQGALGWHSITPMAMEAALIWRLTGRDDAKAYALACIDRLCAVYPSDATPQTLAAAARATPRHTERPKVLSHGEVALAADLCRDALPPAAHKALLNTMKTLCIPFHDFTHALAGYSSGGNIALCRNINAAICALLWGDECGFERWEAVVNSTCLNVRQYLRNGCDEDGFSFEGTGYGEQVFQFVFLFCQLLRQANWPDDLLANEPRLRRIPEAFQHMFLPDGSFCATTNDSGTRAPISLWWLLLTAREYRRPDQLGAWHAYSGPDHAVRPWGDTWPHWARLARVDPRMIEHADKTLALTFLHWDADAPVENIERSPLPTAVCAEGTGTATFRTSWNRNAVFAALLGGGRSRACFGHSHADCGHIDLAVGGEYLAVDTGRYNTNEDQHSVMLIDGQNRHPSSAPGKGMGDDRTSGRLHGLQRHALLDYAVADASHMKSAIWALRHLLFVRLGGEEAYVVLLDNINTDNLPHAYWWQLQCAARATIDLTGPATATVHGPSARIDCSFFQKPESPAPGVDHRLELRQDVQEWVWPYGKDQDPNLVALHARTGEEIASVRRPRLLAIQHTLSGMLLSVLAPRQKDQASLAVAPTPVTNGIGVIVTSEAFSDTLLVAPDHKLILTRELTCFSEFAVLRRDKAGRLVDSWTQSGEPLQFH